MVRLLRRLHRVEGVRAAGAPRSRRPLTRGALVVNGEFLQFASPGGFRPRACRPLSALPRREAGRSRRCEPH